MLSRIRPAVSILSQHSIRVTEDKHGIANQFRNWVAGYLEKDR
jgi:hypothetical protein